MQQISDSDRELANLVLSADSEQISGSASRAMKRSAPALSRSDSTNDLMSKLKLKRDKEKSRYSNLNKDEISMYLRHTSILTTGASKVYGQNFFDPISTVQDYEGDQFFETGEELTSSQFQRLLKLIDKSFDKIHEVEAGMQKPGAKPGVTAKSIKSIYPMYEMGNKPAYLCQYYNEPTKPHEKEQFNNNNESVLLKDQDVDAYNLYTVEKESRGLLGKRTREEKGKKTFIKRKKARYEKKGTFRYTQTDKNIQQGSFLFYDVGENQLAYLKSSTSQILSSYRAKDVNKKRGISLMNLEEEEAQAEKEFISRTMALAEREYTNKEIQRKNTNIEKADAPHKLKSDIVPQEQLGQMGIVEVYDEPPEHIDEEDVPKKQSNSPKKEEAGSDQDEIDDLFDAEDDDDDKDMVSQN